MPARKNRIVLAYPHAGRIAHLVRLRHRLQHGWRGEAECRADLASRWLPVPQWLARGAVLCPACVAHAGSCDECARVLRER